jgi:ribosomal protein S13
MKEREKKMINPEIKENAKQEKKILKDINNVNSNLRETMVNNIKNAMPTEEIISPQLEAQLSPIQLKKEREIKTSFRKESGTRSKPRSGQRTPNNKFKKGDKIKLKNHLSNSRSFYIF